MISQRKLDANRRNAAKSTGPRTAEGKDKVRFNAVTHGFTAATVVLPHEDEEAYQQRLEDWTSELKPPGKLGQYLVGRVVKISWQLDRADTAEQARLAGRIQDAHRLLADGGAEPAEILFARLVGMEEGQPAHSRGSRRDGPARVNSPALLLCTLESSAEGCRRLLDEWTRILDWLGPLGPEGIASTEFDSRRDNIKRALQLVGVPFRDPEDPPVTANDPLSAPFVRAWQALNDHVMIDALGQQIEKEDHWLAALERQAERDRPYWAAVAVELLKLATERRARLKTMLARHQDNEDEARPRLAAEASFDDTAEGERVHRYQERWGRSLLRTLAKIEELRDRGQLDEEETEKDFVGQDSNSVIPFIIEETRLESCPTEGRDVNDGPTGSVEAHPVEETERGQDRVAADDPSIRREDKVQNKLTDDQPVRGEEKVQNKPTAAAVTRTVVKMQPYVDRPVESKATMVHSPRRGSDPSGPLCRPSACAGVVNYTCRE